MDAYSLCLLLDFALALLARVIDETVLHHLVRDYWRWLVPNLFSTNTHRPVLARWLSRALPPSDLHDLDNAETFSNLYD